MKLTVRALFSLLAILLMISCAKEFSFQNNQATGTIKDPLTGDCLESEVSGSFIKDTTLTHSSFIIAQVDVSKTGNYYIETDTLDGFWFAGEGRADTLGLNTIVLFAKGTPTATGTYTFHINYDTSSCPIEVTVTESLVGGTSVFAFSNSTGSCPEVKFNGTYKEQVALDASNTMEFDVTVLKAGTYTISLPAVNGISFSGSGTFAAAGMQHIILKGAGKPVSAGIVTETVSSGTSSCPYSLTVAPPDNLPDAVFTLDCASAKANGTFMEGKAVTGTNTVTVSATVTTAGKYTLNTTAVNGVTFSATGRFNSASATPQVITLTATGTPVAKGAFDYPVAGNSVNCSFKINYDAAPVPAVFTLAGSPNACTAPVINGTYAKGTALNSSNTVVVKVDVTTVGTYSILTTIVGGIQFAATGTFTTTGLQDVTLTGVGNPTTGGTITLTPKVGTNVCSFDVDVTAPAVAPAVFTCKIDGVFTTFNVNANFTTELLGIEEIYMKGSNVQPMNNSVPELSLSVQNNDGTKVKAGTYDEKHFIPTPTSMGYNISANYNAVANGTVTRFGTSSNLLTTNPPFTIVITSITADRIKGTFSGKMTNFLAGDNITKTFTEGVFDLPVK